MKMIVLDTESTGLARCKVGRARDNVSVEDIGSQVIEIGGVIVDDPSKLVGLTPFCLFCDIIPADSDKEAKKVHGIDIIEVRRHVRGQFLIHVLNTWLPEFFEKDLMLIGHNIGFDLDMIRQSVRNAYEIDIPVATSNFVHSKGRMAYDTVVYTMVAGKRRKLQSFEDELQEGFDKLILSLRDVHVRTNAAELLMESCGEMTRSGEMKPRGMCMGAHNALYDALRTFVLWKERVWNQKLF